MSSSDDLSSFLPASLLAPPTADNSSSSSSSSSSSGSGSSSSVDDPSATTPTNISTLFKKKKRRDTSSSTQSTSATESKDSTTSFKKTATSLTETKEEKGEGEEGEEEEEAASLNVRDVRLLQKLRQKTGTAVGIGEEAAMAAAQAAFIKSQQEVAARACKQQEKAQQQQSLDNTQTMTELQTATEFGGQSFQTEEDTQALLIKQQMEAYVAEQMSLRRKSAAASSTSSFSSSSSSSTQDTAAPLSLSDAELYAIPSHLQVTPSKTAEELEEGGGDRWLAGIAEQNIGIQDRLKNIEKTQQAKAKKEAMELAKRAAASTAYLPANFNANFRLHKKEWDGKRREEFRQYELIQARDKARREGLPPPPDNFSSSSSSSSSNNNKSNSSLPGFLAAPDARKFGARPDGSQQQQNKKHLTSSDDRAVDRFIKKMKFK